MTAAREDVNRRMLRARDLMDRSYAEPLDVPSLARVAHVSPAHFARTFRETFGETPHRYLQRRRVERAMYLLRETHVSVSEICLLVGFASLGTFSSTFRAVVGASPSEYRARTPPHPPAVPGCFSRSWTRPSSEKAGGGKAGGSSVDTTPITGPRTAVSEKPGQVASP